MIAVTRQGTELGSRLQVSLPGSALRVPEKFAGLAPGAEPYGGRLAEAVAAAWADRAAEPAGEKRGGLVLVMALGIAVRLIAPLLQDKRRDPAVVVVDDAGRFAISALSGHLGGANALAQQVAGLIGATPVVTTASDNAGTMAVDLIGREFGWEIEPGSDVTGVSAAVVNGELVGVWQEAGEPNWWPLEHPWPENIGVADGIEALWDCAAGLIITDRALDASVLPARWLAYRPHSLVVGVGCNRGTTAVEIQEAIQTTLEEAGLSERSVAGLATIEAKRDEAGLSECASRRGWSIAYYTADELNAVPAPTAPSAIVQREVGAWGVCEPAALLRAGTGRLIVPKRKSGNVTVAVARIAFEMQR